MQKDKQLYTYSLGILLILLASGPIMASQSQAGVTAESVATKLYKNWQKDLGNEEWNSTKKKYIGPQTHKGFPRKPWDIKDTADLHKEVLDYLMKGMEQQLVIIGAMGSGKTVYSHFLQEYLWDSFQRNKSKFIPIRVPLNKSWGMQSGSLEKFLVEEKKLNQEEIDVLRLAKTVFILDGYRHAGKSNNLYDMEFDEYGWDEAKVIITCRSEFLSSQQFDYVFSHERHSAPQLYLAGWELSREVWDYANKVGMTKEKFETVSKLASALFDQTVKVPLMWSLLFNKYQNMNFQEQEEKESKEFKAPEIGDFIHSKYQNMNFQEKEFKAPEIGDFIHRWLDTLGLLKKQEEIECYEALSWDMFERETNFILRKAKINICQSGLISPVQGDKFMFVDKALQDYFLTSKILRELNMQNVDWMNDIVLLKRLSKTVKDESLQRQLQTLKKKDDNNKLGRATHNPMNTNPTKPTNVRCLFL